ncbi:hypothetical protein RRG08_041178 [Elysia crispata]|uniref:Uncharacterized protein n=1 Tax=Elysia crispata TaxID=231223 RepID=A0AAE1CP01_9GAST|nr:hypothetical protein RRG08_041178 [Elysia crispata]
MLRDINFHNSYVASSIKQGCKPRRYTCLAVSDLSKQDLASQQGLHDVRPRCLLELDKSRQSLLNKKILNSATSCGGQPSEYVQPHTLHGVHLAVLVKLQSDSSCGGQAAEYVQPHTLHGVHLAVMVKLQNMLCLPCACCLPSCDSQAAE